MSKNKIFISLFLITSLCGFAQQTPIGEYIRKDEGLTVKDFTSRYFLKNDGSFLQINFQHLESQLHFNGKYKKVGDTLFLMYRSNPAKEKNYKFLKKKKVAEDDTQKVYLFSKIKLIHSSRNTSGIEMLVYDKNKKLLMGFSSNEKGEYPYLSLFDPKIDYFVFSSLHFQEVIIPAKELFGFISEVHIYLNDSKVEIGNRNDTVKYMIQSITNKKIELLDIATKERVVLIKH